MLFMEELAYWMLTKGKDRLHFDTLRNAIDRYFDKETKKILRLSLDNLDYQIRNCSFLSRNNAEGYYVFAHKSFIEYFVACKLKRDIPENKAQEIIINDEIAFFVSELIDPSIYERIEPPTGIEMPQDMVYIPPGQFIMGCGDRTNITRIEKGFFIDKYPVTNAKFCIFLNDKKPDVKLLNKHIDLKSQRETEKCRIKKDGETYKVEKGYENHPVICVSLHGAMAYAKWLGKSIPNEKEWEKANRGIDGRVYPWGNEFDRDRCNTGESNIKQTTPVNRYPGGASPYRCLDMAGNVREWESHEEHALRGGSWMNNREGTRCAHRSGAPPESRIVSIGFRCVKNLK